MVRLNVDPPIDKVSQDRAEHPVKEGVNVAVSETELAGELWNPQRLSGMDTLQHCAVKCNEVHGLSANQDM